MEPITKDQLQQIIKVQSPLPANSADVAGEPLPAAERTLLEPLFRKVSGLAPPGQFKHELIIGPRRAGKTTLLRQLALRMSQELDLDPSQIVFLSLDDVLLSGRGLSEILETLVSLTEASVDKPIFLLADEIAYASDWDTILKTVHDFPRRYPINIIATSSSAMELNRGSQESGVDRWIPTYLFPCQVSEQCRVSWDPIDKPALSGDTLADILASVAPGAETASAGRNALDSFMLFGGFPGRPNLRSEAEDASSLLSYYRAMRVQVNKIVTDDIVSNLHKKNIDSAKSFFNRMAARPCGEIQPSDWQTELGLSPDMIAKLFDCLENALVSFRLPNYAGPKKNKKYYFLNTAVPAAATHQDATTMLSTGRGWAMENMVGSALHELTRHSILGSELFHWRDGDKEVDFIFKENNQDGILAIEVGSSANHSQKGLLAFMEECAAPSKPPVKAYLVAPDAKVETRDNGITTFPLLEFLLAIEYRKDALLNEIALT